MLELTLKEYMEEKGISIAFVHEKTGIRRATISDMVNNKRNSINLKYLGKVMDALRINDISLILQKEHPMIK